MVVPRKASVRPVPGASRRRQSAFPLLGTLVLLAQAATPVAGVGLAPPAAPRSSSQEDSAPVVASESARTWLVLDAVDGGGRRPLSPDAVLAAALTGRRPAPGVEVDGTTGSAAWEERTEGEDGRLRARGVAYTRLVPGEGGVPAAPGLALVRLVGATTARIGDRAVAGDRYAYGWPTQLVPLEPDGTDVYVAGIRGAFSLALEPVEPGVVLAPWDTLVPDALVGEGGELLAAVAFHHAEPREHGRVVVAAAVDGVPIPATSLGTPNVAPLGQRKLPVRLDLSGPLATARAGDELEVLVRVSVVYGRGRDQQRVAQAEHVLRVPVRDPAGLHRRTFLSRQDLSVQEYCVQPPPPGAATPAGEPARLLLSLHGAGVEAWGQASSYAPRPGFWHVAATNRRPFGFDWQDWGRADAYEVLEHALRLTGVSRRYVYLSGHSMGGHGTWHLGANDPDGFAALAPSAGWRSFRTYGGGQPDSPLAALWRQADAASDTEALLSNLVQLPTYVLHADADESVPVAEAEAMVAALRAAGAPPRVHVEPGRGHWWDAGVGPGVDCLAWPGFYELFRDAAVPAAPRTLDFTTVHPSVDARHHWVEVRQLERYGEPARVRGTWTPEAGRIELSTENVRQLVVERPGWGALDELVLDGEALPFDGDALALRRAAEGWRLVEPAGDARPGKSPAAGGPFKRAFDRDFVFVVPTRCGEAEAAAALDVARYHQAVWRYRGNGDAAILRDVDVAVDADVVDPVAVRRNLVLLGNEDTNTAWRAVVRGTPHLRVRPGLVRVGDEEFRGDDLTCLAVLPGQRDPAQQIALLATSGAPALALASVQHPFVSGAGFPDFLVFGADVLTGGDAGVRAAGWFDADWGLQEPVHRGSTVGRTR